MKKIAVFGIVVIALIAVIKLGGPILTASLGIDQTTGQSESQAESQTGAVATNETQPGNMEKPVINIQSETDGTQPETAEATAEAESGAQTQESGAQSTQPAAQPVETTTAAKVYSVKDISKTMYAIKPVNVRESYSTNSPIVSSLKAGQEVQATGESENGWIRVDYTGKVAYVAKNYLTTNKADIETKAATKPAATKPAATKPAPTQPAPNQPVPTQPAPTQPAVPSPQNTPGGNPSETIAPFPG